MDDNNGKLKIPDDVRGIDDEYDGEDDKFDDEAGEPKDIFGAGSDQGEEVDAENDVFALARENKEID
jgi:hypothetical protein|tara:strand:+ start:658 stop:858 length:201 start_codon:yes stop_codon:yes gene_type:complete